MKKIIPFSLVFVLFVFSCTNPSSSGGTKEVDPVDCSDLISKISMDYQSPVEAEAPSTSRSLSSGDTGYGKDQFDSMVGVATPILFLNLFKAYVGTTVVIEDELVNLAAQTVTVDGTDYVFGDSQVKVTISDTTVFLYADLNLQPFTNHTIWANIQFQFMLEGGSGDLTDYTKITFWMIDDANEFKSKSWSDLSTGEYFSYNKPAKAFADIPYSGSVTVNAPDGGGIYYASIYYNSPDTSYGKWFGFGDGDRLVLASYSSYYDDDGNLQEGDSKQYIIDDVDYGPNGDAGPSGASISTEDKTFLDNGSVDNLPPNNWAAATALDTAYDGLYGTDGTFDDEFVVADMLQ